MQFVRHIDRLARPHQLTVGFRIEEFNRIECECEWHSVRKSDVFQQSIHSRARIQLPTMSILFKCIFLPINIHTHICVV